VAIVRRIINQGSLLMKKFFATALAVLSMNSFAQSYMVLDNGIVLTTTKTGDVNDLSNFALPRDVRISGGQFFVQHDKLVTVNNSGLFTTDLTVRSFKGKGMNYIIDGSQLITISAEGFYTKLKDDAFKKSDRFGGVFFTANNDEKKKTADLYTVGANGLYTKIMLDGFNAFDITLMGGNYFFVKGVPYTVATTGFIYPKTDFNIPSVKMMGGNFFIDKENTLYTVAESGFLILPVVLPAELKISEITKVGANYMLDNENRLFTVDHQGNVQFKLVPGHDLKKVKLLSTK